MCEAFTKERVEIEKNPKVNRVLEQHGYIGEKDHVYFDFFHETGEHLKTEREKEMLAQSERAYDEHHFGEHGAHLSHAQVQVVFVERFLQRLQTRAAKHGPSERYGRIVRARGRV